MSTLVHVEYPHEPGRLYDCVACEAECHCTGDPEHTPCVYCANEEACGMDWLDDEEITPYCVTRGCHSPEAGMMVVHPEDLDTVAASRGKVECGDCDMTYRVGKGWS